MTRDIELPPRLNELLGPVGRRAGLEEPMAVSRVWSQWTDIVGDHMAAHAEPSSFKSGVLRIRAESPVWATEIGYLAGELKARINELLGDGVVTEVVVWTGPGRSTKRTKQNAGQRTASEPRRRKPVSGGAAEALERAREAWSRRRSKGSR